MQSKISVIHLVYVPFGTDLLQRFLDSYVKHSSGIEHQLVIMFNGFTDKSETERFLEIVNASGLDYKILYSKEKFDISSYFFAAKILDTEYVLFLNSYSIILADNWLYFYYAAMKQENAGVVGATGAGWRNEFQTFLERKEKMYSSGKISPFVKFADHINRWLHFGRAVFPHLRTNAFFVKREVFLSIKYHKLFSKKYFAKEEEDTKVRTLFFEHGNRSLTGQFYKKGLKVVIIDCRGNAYQPEQWMSAKTFWISEQENLLIHDNQTLRYKNGDEELKKDLAYQAWGIKS